MKKRPQQLIHQQKETYINVKDFHDDIGKFLEL